MKALTAAAEVVETVEGLARMLSPSVSPPLSPPAPPPRTACFVLAPPRGAAGDLPPPPHHTPCPPPINSRPAASDSPPYPCTSRGGRRRSPQMTPPLVPFGRVTLRVNPRPPPELPAPPSQPPGAPPVLPPPTLPRTPTSPRTPRRLACVPASGTSGRQQGSCIRRTCGLLGSSSCRARRPPPFSPPSPLSRLPPLTERR